MHGLREKLMEEEARLELIKQKTANRLRTAPEGTLRISKSNNCIQYYHCQKQSDLRNGKYLHSSEVKLIHELAQKTYDEKVLRLAKRRLNQIERLLREYRDDEIEAIYQKESAARHKLIEPVETTWNQRVGQWMSEEYERKQFKETDPFIYSEKGERVRSKSEKILADYFFHKNIPYKYEKGLYLRGYGMVYPDFTFLSKRTGTEIYWEHEGRMDDPTYAEPAIRKIHTYEDNGIFLGERLILTFETKNIILSTVDIERNVKRFLEG